LFNMPLEAHAVLARERVVARVLSGPPSIGHRA
jgi:hypothetical protein